MTVLEVWPRDPVLARDGRPAGAGSRLKTMPWLSPAVVAGTLRTMHGKSTGMDFGSALDLEALRAMECRGPLPCREGSLYFPAPKDAAVGERGGVRELFPVRPAVFREGEGADFRDAGLLPCTLSDSVADEFKGAPAPAYWRSDRMVEWLLNPEGELFPVPPESSGGGEYLSAPPVDTRIHVAIHADTGAAEDEKLFSSSALAFPEDTGFSVVTGGNLTGLPATHTLGGERRLAYWRKGDADWGCPARVAAGLAKAHRIRMVLATPGLFQRDGRDCWKPGWLDGLEGEVPDTGVRLRLVSASIDRWRPVSGWSLEHRGPKASRRAVPAGGVYFFEYVSGSREKLAERWLRSIASGQDELDGWALALWGIW